MITTPRNYALKISDPAPSMTTTREDFTATSYQEAVAFAHARYLEMGRSITLHSLGGDRCCLHWWHFIHAYSQTAEDRNFNTGIPELCVAGSLA